VGQVQQALGTDGVPTSTSDIGRAARHTTGIRHKVLVSLQHRLERLNMTSVLNPAIDVTLPVFEALIGVLTFAVAAYRIVERDRAIGRSSSRSYPGVSAAWCATRGI
jgi:hypothetical protein